MLDGAAVTTLAHLPLERATDTGLCIKVQILRVFSRIRNQNGAKGSRDAA